LINASRVSPLHLLNTFVKNRPSGNYSELGMGQVTARSSPDAPPDFFNWSQAIFAFLSVIIGLLALVIGLLQLRKYRKRSMLRDGDLVFELEACYPKVWRCGPHISHRV
jgi:hypothetical protein